MTAPPGALAEVLALLDADSEYCHYVAGPPTGDGWIPGTDLADHTVLADWFADGVARRGAGSAPVVGSFLASWIADIIALPVAAAIRTTRRSWPVDLGAIAVHRDTEGWFDGVAVVAGPVRVLSDDPAAAAPGVDVFDDVDDLIATTASEIVAAVTPVFAGVRRVAPFGVRGMWGNLADGLSGDAVWAAHRRRSDTAAAFAAAAPFTDAVAAAADVAIVRPTPLTITWSGGNTVVSRKGTCCLYYKIVPGARPDGDGYCLSCPKREPASQHSAMAAWLDELAMTADA